MSTCRETNAKIDSKFTTQTKYVANQKKKGAKEQLRRGMDDKNLANKFLDTDRASGRPYAGVRMSERGIRGDRIQDEFGKFDLGVKHQRRLSAIDLEKVAQYQGQFATTVMQGMLGTQINPMTGLLVKNEENFPKELLSKVNSRFFQSKVSYFGLEQKIG
jgi:hypothetical protein